MPGRIEIIETDIFSLQINALICVSDPSLQPTTQTTQALYGAAGPKMAEECAHIAPCPVGEARITRGYNLPADFVIHTVVPVWGGGESGEDQQLANSYKHIFELATAYEVTTMAFPFLTDEEPDYPQMRAAHIAMREINQFLQGNTLIKSLKLCCTSDEQIKAYEAAFDQGSS